MRTGRPARRGEDGFMMAALLVAMGVMAIAMSTALPAWQTAARREKEAELIFRGEQYARAIGAFQRKTGGYPQNADILVTEKFLRKKYKDPITGEDFTFVSQGSALPTTSSIAGLTSTQTRAGTGSSTSGTTAGRGSTTTTTTTSGRGGTTASTSSAQTRTTTSTTQTQAGVTTGILAVHSKSREKSFRVYNGTDRYNEWIFMPTAATAAASSPTGGQTPGGGTRGGAAGGRGGAPTGARQGGAGGGRGGGGGGGRAIGPAPR